jgi:hypothetical protein
MHRTAEQLEVAESILHHSAEQSPNTDTTARLHALGDQVTAQAHQIDRRADRLTSEPDRLPQPTPAPGPDGAARNTSPDGQRTRS